MNHLVMDISGTYEIMEDTIGMWHYHLAEEGSTRSLCGKPVMSCGNERWGSEALKEDDGVSETYCEDCEELAS